MASTTSPLAPMAVARHALPGEGRIAPDSPLGRALRRAAEPGLDVGGFQSYVGPANDSFVDAR